MKRSLAICCLLALLFAAAMPAMAGDEAERYPFRDAQTGRWGYIDATGAVVLPPVYDGYEDGTPGHFYRGVSVQYRDGRGGVIDAEGRELLPFAYDWVSLPMEGDVFAVRLDGRRGLVDAAGNWLTPDDGWEDLIPNDLYTPMATFHKDGKVGLVNARGEVVSEAVWREAYVPHRAVDGHQPRVAVVGDDAGKKGLLDEAGRVLLPAEYDGIEGDDRAPLNVRRGGKAGFVALDGTVLIPLEWDGAYTFHMGMDGRTIVTRDGERLFIDGEGTVLGTLEVDDLWAGFYRGLAAASLDGKYGYLDTDGQWAIEPEWDEAGPFSEAGYAVVRRGGRFGVIDRDGAEVVETVWESIVDYNGTDVFVVRRGHGYGLLRADGALIVPTEWEECVVMNGEALHCLRRGGVYGYFDRMGTMVFAWEV